MSDVVPNVATGTSPTLGDLFQRACWRRPDASALIDPPNKQRINGQNSLRLTYAEADRAIGEIAAQFIEAGLPPGSIIAMQLPNTVEFPIALLAALRAGLIVALLPQLWRQSELTTALNNIGARAIVSVGRIELVDHAELIMTVASDVFSIRHVFGFGNHLPDGMTQLRVQTDPATAPRTFAKVDALKPAILSFDVTADGLCAVPRNHVQLIAGGLAVMLESGMPADANILSTIAPASFGGLAASLLTWLLSGRTLSLYHPGDIDVLTQQIAGPHHDILVAPAPLALKLAEVDAFSSRSSIDHVIGLWRTPERTLSSERWPIEKVTLTDVLLFGEVGLVAANRMPDGLPVAIGAGAQLAPRARSNGKIVGEVTITPRGMLALRGAMVPAAAYRRAQQDRDTPPDPDAPVDTGYGARLQRNTGTIEITAPPAGIVAVGGYRFRAHDFDEWSKRLGADATLTALPDQLNGHRIAGSAIDMRRVREALGELGLNPLLVEAFRNRADPA